jgi:hypothetical protein
MVQQTLDGMIAVGIGCDMTKRIVRSDGKLRVIRYVGVPVFANDIVTRFIETLTEITEQETATQDLRLSQAYREQAGLSAPAASAGIYRADNWFARTRLFDP